jgi:hypothetical protein
VSGELSLWFALTTMSSIATFGFAFAAATIRSM